MFDDVLAKLSDGHFLAVLLVSIGCAATVLTLAMPLLQTDTLGRRIKAVSTERERIRIRERERMLAAQNKAQLRGQAERTVSSSSSTRSICELALHRHGQDPAGDGGLSRPERRICVPDLPASSRRSCSSSLAMHLHLPDPALEPAAHDQARPRRSPRSTPASRRRRSSCATRSPSARSRWSAPTPTRSICC